MSELRVVRYGDDGFREAYGDAWSCADESMWRRYYTPDVVYVEGGTHTSYEGIDAAARFFRFMYRFAADSRIDFINLFGDNAGFGAEWVWTGIAQGPLLVDGVVYPPTNLPFSVDGAAVCKVNSDGLVTYHKDYYDVRALMAQLQLVQA
ncbi:MAG: ester cyclase [Ilumatobacteraceae bacterium]